jgi:hypothetical protein
MQQVIDWGENGQPPAVLNACGSVNNQSVIRPLWPYPGPDAIYTGGDPTVAASYTCSSRPHFCQLVRDRPAARRLARLKVSGVHAAPTRRNLQGEADRLTRNFASANNDRNPRTPGANAARRKCDR